MTEFKYDYLIVGAGLFGAVFAQQTMEKGKKVLIIDKRDHIAGNIYTEKQNGIDVHKYGAHIFHTNNKKAWEYVNRFADFNRYTNSPVANYKGEIYSLPFNMYTFNKMWNVTTPKEAKEKIEKQREEAGITNPQNLEQQAISLVGKDIYEKLIKGYTYKQWGRECDKLPSFIIKRLPVRFTYDNNYFNALYQGIPVCGYTSMVSNMLNGADVITGVDYLDDCLCTELETFLVQKRLPTVNIAKETITKETITKENVVIENTTKDNTAKENTINKYAKKEVTENDKKISNKEILDRLCEKVIYTGAIDGFFEYCFGPLMYRSVRFETEMLPIANYQGNAVVNYTDAQTPYTRIIEHKWFTFGKDEEGKDIESTIISREYSSEWEVGMEPYYPVNDEANAKLFEKYRQLAGEIESKVVFGGRLGQYKYYDMDAVILEALALSEKLLG